MQKVLAVVVATAMFCACSGKALAMGKSYRTGTAVKQEPAFESLSTGKEHVECVPAAPVPGAVDAGEQPGWTKLKLAAKYKEKVLTKEDALYCFESYGRQRAVNLRFDPAEITKDTIIVKHEEERSGVPILKKEPTIKPYEIEVFKAGGLAVDCEGNIYQYQTWA